MAINTFINMTLNPNATKIPDDRDHKNSGTVGASSAGTVSVGYDSAVITSVSLLRSCLADAVRIAAGKLPQ